jgi:hypothetical protein
MLPNPSVFHPNRELSHQQAERISESPDRAKLAEKLGRFIDERPLTLPSLTVSWLNAAIRVELVSRLFLLSIIALIFAKITGSPSGTASNRVLFSAVLSVAAIGAVADVAWRSETTKMIFSSLGVTNIVTIDSGWSSHAPSCGLSPVPLDLDGYTSVVGSNRQSSVRLLLLLSPICCLCS